MTEVQANVAGACATIEQAHLPPEIAAALITDIDRAALDKTTRLEQERVAADALLEQLDAGSPLPSGARLFACEVPTLAVRKSPGGSGTWTLYAPNGVAPSDLRVHVHVLGHSHDVYVRLKPQAASTFATYAEIDVLLEYLAPWVRARALVEPSDDAACGDGDDGDDLNPDPDGGDADTDGDTACLAYPVVCSCDVVEGTSDDAEQSLAVTVTGPGPALRVLWPDSVTARNVIRVFSVDLAGVPLALSEAGTAAAAAALRATPVVGTYRKSATAAYQIAAYAATTHAEAHAADAAGAANAAYVTARTAEEIRAADVAALGAGGLGGSVAFPLTLWSATGIVQSRTWRRHRWSAELALALIRHGMTLSVIPPAFRTVEVCLVAVQNNGLQLRGVAAAQCTEDVCLAAVRCDGRALEYVPDERRSADVCLAAVSSRGSAIQHVPLVRCTEALCSVAVDNDVGVLAWVPGGLRTPAICLAAAVKDAGALQHVPAELQTPELCDVAVLAHPCALRHVPEALQTPDMCSRAVEAHPLALQYVSPTLRTPAMVAHAVQRNGNAILALRRSQRTPELVHAAYQQQAQTAAGGREWWAAAGPLTAPRRARIERMLALKSVTADG